MLIKSQEVQGSIWDSEINPPQSLRQRLQPLFTELDSHFQSVWCRGQILILLAS
jgi:hypothetical protein